MGVPQFSSMLVGVSPINQPFWVTSNLGRPHLDPNYLVLTFGVLGTANLTSLDSPLRVQPSRPEVKNGVISGF